MAIVTLQQTLIRTLLVSGFISLAACGSGSDPKPRDDTTPNAFTFAAIENAEASTQVDFDPVTITGTNKTTPISAVGGQYAIGSGAFTATTGTVENNQAAKVRVASSATTNTAASVADVEPNTVHTTNTITLSGIKVKNQINSTAPSTITRTIKQDRQGNLWIAAFDGVFRYDGKSFTNITSEVSSARFFSVLEDRKGNFWFSSIGSGVFYYDGSSFLNFTTKDGLANDEVSNIYEDQAGNIWFGTEGGASRYDGKSFRNYMMNSVRSIQEEASIKEDSLGQSSLSNTTKEGPPKNDDNDVNAIVEDKTGKFWFGTRGHASFYDGKTFTVFTHNGKPFTNVRSIIKDRKGNIWLGGSDGLWRYDGSTFTNFTRNFVGYIYEDRKGNIWTISETAQGWVLSSYELNSMSFGKPTVKEIRSKHGENNGMIFGILEANDGSIWFGSLFGVHRYDGKTITDFKSE